MKKHTLQKRRARRARRARRVHRIRPNEEVHVNVDELLGERLLAPVGQPLRVAVYARLADGIRGGVFPLGGMLPRETELAETLGISRTPVREALMLLEEDGLIVTRRGVGRFVAEVIPHVGLEIFQPFEQVFATPGTTIAVQPREMRMEPTTDFISRHLALDPAANIWFRECLLVNGDEPIAIVQEHLPAGKYLNDLAPKVSAVLASVAAEPATLLTAIQRECGPIFTADACEITANVAGRSRGGYLKVKASDPVLVLTQTAKIAGTPAYLAKCIVSSATGSLITTQTNPVA
jgi:GntR family transcriptional regulator